MIVFSYFIWHQSKKSASRLQAPCLPHGTIFPHPLLESCRSPTVNYYSVSQMRRQRLGEPKALAEIDMVTVEPRFKIRSPGLPRLVSFPLPDCSCGVKGQKFRGLGASTYYRPGAKPV